MDPPKLPEMEKAPGLIDLSLFESCMSFKMPHSSQNNDNSKRFDDALPVDSSSQLPISTNSESGKSMHLAKPKKVPICFQTSALSSATNSREKGVDSCGSESVPVGSRSQLPICTNSETSKSMHLARTKKVSRCPQTSALSSAANSREKGVDSCGSESVPVGSSSQLPICTNSETDKSQDLVKSEKVSKCAQNVVSPYAKTSREKGVDLCGLKSEPFLKVKSRMERDSQAPKFESISDCKRSSRMRNKLKRKIKQFPIFKDISDSEDDSQCWNDAKNQSETNVYDTQKALQSNKSDDLQLDTNSKEKDNFHAPNVDSIISSKRPLEIDESQILQTSEFVDHLVTSEEGSDQKSIDLQKTEELKKTDVKVASGVNIKNVNELCKVQLPIFESLLSIMSFDQTKDYDLRNFQLYSECNNYYSNADDQTCNVDALNEDNELDENTERNLRNILTLPPASRICKSFDLPKKVQNRSFDEKIVQPCNNNYRNEEDSSFLNPGAYYSCIDFSPTKSTDMQNEIDYGNAYQSNRICNSIHFPKSANNLKSGRKLETFDASTKSCSDFQIRDGKSVCGMKKTSNMPKLASEEFVSSSCEINAQGNSLTHDQVHSESEGTRQNQLSSLFEPNASKPNKVNIRVNRRNYANASAMLKNDVVLPKIIQEMDAFCLNLTWEQFEELVAKKSKEMTQRWKRGFFCNATFPDFTDDL